MKYIEKNENVTREYEVVINDKELLEIVNELNAKCSRSLKVSTNVTAYDENEALEKINKIRKNEINSITKSELPEYNKGSLNTNKPLYLFECEYFRKQNPYLAYLLTTALTSYRSIVGANVNSNNTIGMLVDYADSDELKPYEVRMARDGITKELYDEYENNKDFDFALLNELYEKAKKCFKLVLLSETISYDNVDEKQRVYKLGGR